MFARRLPALSLVFASLSVIAVPVPAAADYLVGIEWNTGRLYRISSTDASLSLLAETGLDRIGPLERAPDGALYGFGEVRPNPLYRIDPATLTPTRVGFLSGSAFEGSIAFAPNGTAYATNGEFAFNPRLLRIDLATGSVTDVGTMAVERDVNGLMWRSDGQLVGIDRVTNSIVRIDPANAAMSQIAPLAAVAGAVGGMTVLDGTAYFTTAGPTAGIPGSNELWSFDPFTGVQRRIGSFSPVITGAGISGLATLVPEPYGVFPLLGLAGAMAFTRRAARAES